MKTETIEVNGKKYLINIHFENRNNTKASIGKKFINIRIPLCIDREEQSKQLTKMKSWLIKKLQENPERFKSKQKEYKDKEILKVGNEEYLIRINFKENEGSSARIIDNIINLLISSKISKEEQDKHISVLISRCIAKEKLPKLKERVKELNSISFNKEINRIFLKNNASNWGSCSSDGNINISTRILFAPSEVIDYVIIHELAHIIEPNHSEDFWRLVENAMPNYKEKINWLKENGKNLKF